MKTYTAACQRDGNWWAISVPEIKGVHTQARRLEQVEATAREAIALMLDVDPDSFAVAVEPEVPAAVTEALNARRAADEAREKAEAATREAIAELREAGLSVRDAGSMLDLSPQRVSQIAPKRRPAAAGGVTREGRVGAKVRVGKGPSKREKVS